MLLTDSERKQFIEYCEQEIQTRKSLLSQAEKLNFPPLIAHEKQLLAAYIVIHRDLASVEVMTIEQFKQGSPHAD